jgi:WhiB family transcriptional regulator, redox-sensing transcriptional regulator
VTAHENARLVEIADRLARLRRVPSGVLAEIVARDGACMQVDQQACTADGPPRWLHEDGTDRDLAARLCQGCPIQDQCLELELRTFGKQTVGIWGALGEDERRALVPLWQQAAAQSTPGPKQRTRPSESDEEQP